MTRKMRKIDVLVVEDRADAMTAAVASIKRTLEAPPNSDTIETNVDQIGPCPLSDAVKRLIERFADNKRVLPDLVVLDWKLDELGGEPNPEHSSIKNGVELFVEGIVPRIRGRKTRFILVSGFMQDHDPVEKLGTGYKARLEAALELGLFDFWRKPFDDREIRSSLESMFDLPSRWKPLETIYGWRNAIRRVLYNGSSQEGLAATLGCSDGFRRLVTQARQLSQADRGLCVLVRGESGSGKEHVARMIHDFEQITADELSTGQVGSAPTRKPFRAVNCSEFTDTLLQSQLFGHKKGAFTGATDDQPGVFERADGGTVFLDEVGEVSREFQAMLLRFLETRQVTRLGDEGGKGKKVDVRLVLATDSDLERALADGKLSNAFYHRISALTLQVPPLRERLEDIPLLAAAFSQTASGHMVTEEPNEGAVARALTPGALVELRAADWPGNVRQLRGVISLAVVLAKPDPTSRDQVQLTRAHVCEALGLASQRRTNSLLEHVEVTRTDATLAKLRVVEKVWQAIDPDYNPAHGRAPNGVERVMDVVTELGVLANANPHRLFREDLDFHKVIAQHRNDLKYLYHWLTRGKKSINLESLS